MNNFFCTFLHNCDLQLQMKIRAGIGSAAVSLQTTISTAVTVTLLVACPRYDLTTYLFFHLNFSFFLSGTQLLSYKYFTLIDEQKAHII